MLNLNKINNKNTIQNKFLHKKNRNSIRIKKKLNMLVLKKIHITMISLKEINLKKEQIEDTIKKKVKSNIK